MISWIQKNLQQHFRVVFVVLLVVIIIAFVFTIGETGWGGAGQGGKRYVESFFDLDLTKREDQSKLLGDAALSVRLQAGYDLFQGPQLQDYALRRYAILHIANKIGMPDPTGREVSEYIRGLGMFLGKDGKFDAKRYDEFRDSIRTNPYAGEGDINRVIVDDIRVRRAEPLLAGPGYVLLGEAKKQLVRADTQWTIGLATVDFAEFNPEISVTDADLQAFLEKNPAVYEIPAKVQVGCIEFAAGDFAQRIQISDREAREFYDINPSRFPRMDDKKSTKTDFSLASTPGVNPDADFEAVRPQVEAALRADRAKRMAARAAAELSLSLYEEKITSATLDGFLAVRKLAQRQLAPFSLVDGPSEFGGSGKIAEEAFKLQNNRVFSDVVETPTGYAILAFKGYEAARPALVGEIKDRLRGDYIAAEKSRLFAEAGAKLKAHIESRIQAGDSFEAAATSGAERVGSAKISAQMLPSFTLRTPPETVNFSIFAILDSLNQGQVADMVVGRESPNGLIIYAAEKKEPVVGDNSPQLAQMRAQMGQVLAAQSLNEYLSLLIRKELSKSVPQ